MSDTRICGPGTNGRGYCGRRSKTIATNWANVTCADCKAAQHADHA